MYLAKFGKSYNSVSEYEMRKAIFNEELAYIDETNARQNSYRLGYTPFTDWTMDEFKGLLGLNTDPNIDYCAKNKDRIGEKVDAPTDSVDWVGKKKVGPVKDQGACGSCWAFSAVGALEAGFAIHFQQEGQEFQQYSEQQLIDCNRNDISQGCNGGEMYDAFEFYSSHGICFEENYPYEAKNGECRDSSCKFDEFRIAGYEMTTDCDPTTNFEFLEQAPNSLGVAAGNRAWKNYVSGELDEDADCSTRLDHGVLLTGYIKERDAWQIKNSWSTSWGEDGYIYIKNDHTIGEGICGVNMELSKPHLYC